MDIAIVTGASSSLGLAISRRLIQLGFRVYGLGGDYTDCSLQNVNFKPLACDLADPAAVAAAARGILEAEKGVYLIVNNAKFFGRNPFPQMELGEMDRILRINLLCPLVLVQTLQESLKAMQGCIIQLGAAYVETSRGGAAGAASSGGLKWMGDLLFHELRDHGVRVCHIAPEPNRIREGRVTVRPGTRTEASIDAEAVAQAVEQLLQSPYGNVITELVMRPLRTQEQDIEPVRKLPYPEPQPIPYTVPREIIEAEEKLEEEEFQQQEEQQRERRRDKREKRRERQQAPAQGESDGSDRSDRSDRSDKPDRPPREKRPPAPAAPAPAPAAPAPAAAPVAQPPREPHHDRRKRRKPRPPGTPVGFLNKPPQQTAPQAPVPQPPAPAPAPIPAPVPAAEPSPQPSAEAAGEAAKPARKRPRRAPRKAARKSDGKKPAPDAEDGTDSA